MAQVLVCGAMVVTLSMGIRHGFGLWLQPVTIDRGLTRETFAPANYHRKGFIYGKDDLLIPNPLTQPEAFAKARGEQAPTTH